MVIAYCSNAVSDNLRFLLVIEIIAREEKEVKQEKKKKKKMALSCVCILLRRTFVSSVHAVRAFWCVCVRMHRFCSSPFFVVKKEAERGESTNRTRRSREKKNVGLLFIMIIFSVTFFLLALPDGLI